MNILYIEDDSVDVELARRALRQADADVQVISASTIEEAMAALLPSREPALQFDLVLTDLRLPDGSGLDILYAIRHARLPLPVVVLTGQGDEDVAISAIKAGADDYITKRGDYHRRLPDIVRAAAERFRKQSLRRRGSLRVLYAEHDPGSGERTQQHLAQHAPHIRLDLVGSGQEVLARLPHLRGEASDESSNYDVLLLDFNLPDVRALELLKIIDDERQLDVPVVLVTSQGNEEVAVQALRLGATGYIVKHAGYLSELPIALENANYHARLAREQNALRSSEERFRRLAENAPDLIYRYVLLPQPRLEYVSPAAIVLTGYTPEEHYADPDLVFKIVDPDDHQRLKQAIEGEIPFGEPVILRWRHRNGSTIWAEQRNTPIFDSSGRLTAIEGIARDVTQTRETMATLQQRLGELEALHHLSNALRTAQTQDTAVAILLSQTLAALQTEAAAIWLWDPQSERLHVAAAGGWCQAFYGTRIARGEGITGRVFVTAEAHVEPDILHNSGLAEGLRSLTPGGWGAGWAPIRTSDANVGVLFVALPLPREVTPEQSRLLVSLAEIAGSIIQRLQLLQRTQDQAELTRQIVNTVPEGLTLMTGSGHILLANAAGESLLREFGDLQPEGAVAAIGGRSLSEILAPEKGWQELVYGSRTFILNARPVEPQSDDTSWVLVLDEVTQEREQQRYQEAQDRLATVGQLAAGLAHDFNNVLGVISVYADVLLMASNLTPKQQQQLSTIVDQTHHAGDLVRQILDFSRRSVMERSHVDLYQLLNEQVRLLRHTLPETIELKVNLQHTHLVVNADPTRLRQVLMNLALNARDAIPNGGTLTFTLGRVNVALDDNKPAPLPDVQPGPWLRLEVADTGTGIAAAHLPHIFEPFFTTKAPGTGSGLGLAQVYGIVKQHGGAIDVASTPGKGTTFTIYLPLTTSEPTPAAAHESPPAANGSECILLVEDNADLREALSQSLAGLGYHVLPAQNAVSALELAGSTNREIDLVLTDLVMPGASGVELFHALQPSHPKAKLIVMTGHPMTEARMDAMKHIPHWIEKPFAFNTVAAKVRQVLNQEQHNASR
jgi:two-component system, cell cycle sensor histidine kinase and response regulator CckA